MRYIILSEACLVQKDNKKTYHDQGSMSVEPKQFAEKILSGKHFFL